MAIIDAILSALGLSKTAIFTGAVGAAVAALCGDAISRRQRVLNFTLGFFIAAWGSSAIIQAFGLVNTPTWQGALGFTLGYLGMSIAEKAGETVRQFKLSDWVGRRP